MAEEVFVATTAAIAGVVPGSRCHLSGLVKLHDIPVFDVGNMFDDAARKVHLLDELNYLLGQLKVVLEYLVTTDCYDLMHRMCEFVGETLVAFKKAADLITLVRAAIG